MIVENNTVVVDVEFEHRLLRAGETTTPTVVATAGADGCRIERVTATVRPRIWQPDGTTTVADSEHTLVSDLDLRRGGRHRESVAVAAPPRTPGTPGAADVRLWLSLVTDRGETTVRSGVDVTLSPHERALLTAVPGDGVCLVGVTRYETDGGYTHAYEFGDAPLSPSATTTVVARADRRHPQVAVAPVDPRSVVDWTTLSERSELAVVGQRVRETLGEDGPGSGR
jgi:hypothetical protein